MMDDLMKENKKDYTDTFNGSINEIKNQLKQLNLFKDLDNIFDD